MTRLESAGIVKATDPTTSQVLNGSRLKSAVMRHVVAGNAQLEIRRR